jgi:hypothetical protein
MRFLDGPDQSFSLTNAKGGPFPFGLSRIVVTTIPDATTKSRSGGKP